MGIENFGVIKSEAIQACFSRHAPKHKDASVEESEEFKGLTVNGVEVARNAARTKQKEIVDTAPENAVIFIGGATYEPRTKSTAKIYGEELQKIYKEDSNVKIITNVDIAKYADKSVSEGIQTISEEVKSHKGKVVIIAPMFIKELDFGKGWGYWDENHRGQFYLDYLMEKYNGDEDAGFKEWLETGGKLNSDKITDGPTPIERAKSILAGLHRLKAFTAKQVGENKPIIVSGVGHRWDLDVFITYMATGEVSYDAFIRVTGGLLSNETELALFKIDEDGHIVCKKGYQTIEEITEN